MRAVIHPGPFRRTPQGSYTRHEWGGSPFPRDFSRPTQASVAALRAAEVGEPFGCQYRRLGRLQRAVSRARRAVRSHGVKCAAMSAALIALIVIVLLLAFGFGA